MNPNIQIKIFFWIMIIVPLSFVSFIAEQIYTQPTHYENPAPTSTTAVRATSFFLHHPYFPKNQNHQNATLYLFNPYNEIVNFVVTVCVTASETCSTEPLQESSHRR